MTGKRARTWTTQESWSNLVVLCSGTSWDGPRLSDRHLAEHLSAHVPVLFVDPPLSWATPLVRPELRRSAFRTGLRRLGPGLARLTPLAPPGVSRPGLRRVALLATRSAIRRATTELGGDVRAVIVGSLDDLFGSCGERVRLLWGTDDFAAAGDLMGLSASWLAERERRQLDAADVIVAVSENLADTWRSKGHRVTVIPNGCDTRHYSAVESAGPTTDVTLEPPIATFVGHLSERIDLRVLEAVAETGHSLLLVGPRQSTFELDRIEALLARDNVTWVGAKHFDALPSYLRITDVGLTPYVDSSFNRSSFPLKTLEYLAAGKPVVSTDLPSARWLDTPLVSIASTPGEFAAETHRLLTSSQDPARVEQARAFAAEHDWRARAADMAQLLEEADLHG